MMDDNSGKGSDEQLLKVTETFLQTRGLYRYAVKTTQHLRMFKEKNR